MNLLLAMARNIEFYSQLSELQQPQSFLPLIHSNRDLEDYEGTTMGLAFFYVGINTSMI